MSGDLQQTGGQPTATATDGGTPAVLVVEDQEKIAEAYERALSETYDVTTATSGRAALDALDEHIDVVLLDRRMPDLSGDEVLRRIEAMSIAPQVAMVTAVEPDEDILEMPFDEYVNKPLRTHELEALVEVLLAREAYDSEYRRLFRLLAKKVVLENANKGWTDTYSTVSDRLVDARESLADPEDDVLPQHCEFH